MKAEHDRHHHADDLAEEAMREAAAFAVALHVGDCAAFAEQRGTGRMDPDELCLYRGFSDAALDGVPDGWAKRDGKWVPE